MFFMNVVILVLLKFAHNLRLLIIKTLTNHNGPGVLNTGVVFLRFVTQAFLLFLRGRFSNPAEQSLTIN